MKPSSAQPVKTAVIGHFGPRVPMGQHWPFNSRSSRAQYSDLLRIFAVCSLIATLPTLGACTASHSPVAQSLETAALAQSDATGVESASGSEEQLTDDFSDNDAESTSATEADMESPVADPDALPVPAQAVVSGELALNGTAFDVVASPASQAISDSTVEITDAGDDEFHGADETSVPDPSAQQPAMASIDPGANEAAQDNSGTGKSAKPNFFERLFGTRKSAKPASNPVPQKTVRPSVDTTLARASAPLPGVKSNNDLFGINENNSGEDASVDRNIQLASVGAYGRLISSQGLLLQTESVKVECLKPELLHILKIVERRYSKPVMVTSGYRSPTRNQRAGGVRNSTHIYCQAADIQVEGVSKWDLSKFLRTVDGRGGVGTYCRTNSVHIDIGTQRDWHYPCRRSKSRLKKKS